MVSRNGFRYFAVGDICIRLLAKPINHDVTISPSPSSNQDSSHERSLKRQSLSRPTESLQDLRQRFDSVFALETMLGARGRYIWETWTQDDIQPLAAHCQA